MAKDDSINSAAPRGHYTDQPSCQRHTSNDGSWWEYDAQGIALCRVCNKCKKEKLAKYRPEILQGYNQLDVDEPIEED